MQPGIGSVRGGFKLLEHLFPSTPLESLTSDSLETLAAQYKAHDRWGSLLMVVVFLVVAAIYYGLIVALSRAVHGRLPGDVRHIMGAGPSADWLCALFLSLASSTFFVFLVMRLFHGRQEHAIYMAYQAKKSGMKIDFHRLYRWILLIVFPPLVLWVVCYLTAYTAFTDSALIESPLWSFGMPRRTLPYTDIRGIYLVRKYHARFQDVEMPSFLIAFKAGDRWQSSPATPVDIEAQLPMIKFVARRSGVRLQEIEFADQVPR